jgi:hypothetical protein
MGDGDVVAAQHALEPGGHLRLVVDDQDLRRARALDPA